MKRRRDAKTKLAIVFAAFAAISLAAIGFKALAWPAIEGALAASAAEEEPKPPEEVEKAEVEKAAGLTEADAAKVAAYAEDAKDISDLLVANRWVGRSNSGSGAYIEFGPGYCIEHADGREKVVRKFVIEAARADAGSASSRNWVFSATFGEGKSIFSLNMEEVPRPTNSAQAGDEQLTYSITGPDFTYAQSYLVEQAASEFEADELDAGLLDYLGGQKAQDALETALREWAAKRHPSASKASWNGQAEIDYAAKTADLVFELDDAASTKAYVHADASKKPAVFAVGSTKQTSAKAAADAAGEGPAPAQDPTADENPTEHPNAEETEGQSAEAEEPGQPQEGLGEPEPAAYAEAQQSTGAQETASPQEAVPGNEEPAAGPADAAETEPPAPAVGEQAQAAATPAQGEEGAA